MYEHSSVKIGYRQRIVSTSLQGCSQDRHALHRVTLQLSVLISVQTNCIFKLSQTWIWRNAFRRRGNCTLFSRLAVTQIRTTWPNQPPSRASQATTPHPTSTKPPNSQTIPLPRCKHRTTQRRKARPHRLDQMTKAMASLAGVYFRALPANGFLDKAKAWK